ncbi:MAG: multidrug ABC transporter permease [Oscillatoria sp. SIO1A7]|nr:multidrug ABC transporter permease [Oscillatoria sp. SIO1A7]
MRRFFRVAKTLAIAYYAFMLEYRAELILWMLAGSLPIILMGVWTQAAESGQFGGLTPTDFVRYFIAIFFVRQLTIVWVIWDFEEEVVQGKLSPKLLQPLDPVWHHFIGHLSERLARLPFLIGLIVLFFGLYPKAFVLPSLRQFLLFCLALLLAFILRFLIQYTLAMFAFWIERAAAIEQVSFFLYIFLSGYIAPLEVFPESVRQVLQWTPFPYLLHFPATLLIGWPEDLGRSFLVTLVWIGIFFGCNRFLWRRGLQHYSGMGA